MSLQDRAYAVGIFIVLGICCLGAYVAVSGFMNANPGGLTLSFAADTPSPSPASTVKSTTEAPAAVTVPPLPTVALVPPTNTPKGRKPSPTSPSHGTPSPGFLTDLVTLTPPAPAATATSVSSSDCGSRFCPRLGGADPSLGPTGQACPGNYIWGIVYGRNGEGLANRTIRYHDPQGESKDIQTKAPPDPAGRYDIPTPGGGTWTVQLVEGGQPLSPAYRVQARQRYNGGSICPTRVDFVEQ